VTAAAPPLERRGESHKYVIAFAVVIASMMQVIDSSIVNVAIPHMMGNLGASLDEIAWVSTGYILASVIVIPLTGFFAAFFGRKRYFVASILIFTAASVFCGASHSLEALIFWRIVQGLGGGALVSTSQAVLFEAFPREEMGTAMALFGMGIMVGPTLGPTLGGYITDNFSWPWIFYVNVPIGIFAAVMVLAFVHDHPHHVRTRHVDYWGIALLAVSAGSLQYLLEHGQREDWFDSRLIVGLAAVAVVGSALLVWRELTAERPAIDLRVLRHRQMWVGTVLGVMVSISLFGSVFVLPVFLQGTLHMTAWQTGMIILPGALATAASMALSGKISRYLDARFLVASGSLFFFSSMWMLSRITAQSGAGDFFWPLILRGMGLGVVFVPLTTITLSGLDLKEIPQATGVSNFFRQLGASLGIAMMATLLMHYTQQSRAVLAAHVSWYDLATRARLDQLARAFVGRGADALTAQGRALTVLQGQVMQQASILAFSRLYLLSGLVLVGSMLLLLLLKKPRLGAGRLGPVAAE
jgi:DHA2 family multidrug resistance protein